MAPPRKVEYVRGDYAHAVGDDALERQRQEAAVRFDCCGELKTDGHHPMCRKADADGAAVVIDGQETLL